MTRIAGLLFGARGSGSFVDSGVRGLEGACARFGCDLALFFCDAIEVTERQQLLAASVPRSLTLW